MCTASVTIPFSFIRWPIIFALVLCANDFIFPLLQQHHHHVCVCIHAIVCQSEALKIVYILDLIRSLYQLFFSVYVWLNFALLFLPFLVAINYRICNVYVFFSVFFVLQCNALNKGNDGASCWASPFRILRNETHHFHRKPCKKQGKRRRRRRRQRWWW